MAPRKPKDLTGRTYGMLTVLSEDIYHFRRVICQCACGHVVSVFRSNLSTGNTKSCGCLDGKAPKVTYALSPSGEYWYPTSVKLHTLRPVTSTQ